VDELHTGRSVGSISRRFHATVAAVIGSMVRRIAERTSVAEVVLSGGCFQNRLLLDLTLPLLKRGGLRTYVHRQVPCNDGGIALGQAVVANAVMKARQDT
jgi:hydrogenase maturation protein HypF